METDTRTFEPGSTVPKTFTLNFQDTVTLLARLLLAAIFLLSGFAKIGTPTETTELVASAGIPFAGAAYIAVIALEIIGGLALIAGFKVRIVASVLALFTVAAALLFHTDFGDQNQLTHFLKNLALAGGLLHVAAFGAGWYALDRDDG